MAYISLNDETLPGIVGLLNYRSETAKPLRQLAEVLLRGSSSLTCAEREIIASCVSYWNECHFCHTSHGAAAAAHLQTDVGFINEIKSEFKNYNISEKLSALLRLAKKVQQGGKNVSSLEIEDARNNGATDQEIHDTVLIAAAFCMYNRYVDGLGTWAPEENEAYIEMGRSMAENGYEKKP